MGKCIMRSIKSRTVRGVEQLEQRLLFAYALSPNPATVNENVGSITFSISRSGAFPAETVYVSTLQGSSNGYATNSGDYGELLNQAVTFPANQTQAIVTVPITDDSVIESTETFGLIVQSTAGDPLSMFLANTSFTIIDDDESRLPPQLTAVKIGDGSGQASHIASFAFSFDQHVTLTVGWVKLQLLNSGGSGANNGTLPTDISAALDVATTEDGGKTWVLTFVAGSAFVQPTLAGNSAGSLVDGIYTLTIDPAKISANGVAMAAAPPSLTFHRLFGDVNGDGAVNPLDYLKFRQSFGKSSGEAAFNAGFDFNGDGAVNPLDYVQFRSRFGKAFTYP
jgi:hypothetical protein